VTRKSKHNTYIFLFLFFVIISSCSTKKKTFVHRKYHDITAKYNGYFNGNENLKYGINKLEKSQKDDYSNILSIFKHSNIESSTSHHSYMDKSIKKGSIVIQNHSINIRNKEYCKWIDDSYFLVAKAYYFKGQYSDAKKTFEFIKKNFKRTEIAFESELWIAKCYISLEDFYSAENILDELQSKKKFPEKLDKELHLTIADLYLKQNMLSDVVDELKSACNLIKRKNKKSRFYYIIAQIYQDAGNASMSKKYFELVLDANPEYEMVFNTKMNLARTLRNKKDLNQMRGKLLKMVRDEKNKDYLDQIYFTLAEMDIVDKDTSSAIVNYRLSTKHSIDNDVQKSLSFLYLGKIYYNKSDYRSSKTFYDSAFVFMPEEHQLYKETKQTQQILERLVSHLTTISLEDSLQMLASLSVDERRKIIQSVIAEVVSKEQEELRQKQNRNSRGVVGRNGRNESFGNNTSGGKWYFYNPATLSFGLSEFRKKWGKRKLEDDWRRINKKTLTSFEGDSTTVNKSDKNNSQDLKSEKYYLDQLPLTEKDIEESNTKIINAYYQASLIYKEELDELSKSEKMLGGLVLRFPEHKELTPLSYYLIYNLQIKNKNLNKATKTKQTLITRFPESNYAKTLLDSNFIQSVLSKNHLLEQEYVNIYSHYMKDSFELSYNYSLTKLEQESTEENLKHTPKYYLINIMSEFKINKDSSTFIKNLETCKIEYPNTETSKRCDELLNLMKDTKDIKERNTTALLKTPYRFKDNTTHYFMLVCPKHETDINFIKTLISDFNIKNFSLEELEINTMLLGLEKHLLIVKHFQNISTVTNYSNVITSNKTIIEELKKSDYKKIIISEKNFAEFYKNKDIEGYSRFFDNNYLEN